MDFSRYDKSIAISPNKIVKLNGYYFKYKNEINTLIFRHSPEVVDYSDDVWSKYKGVKQYYKKVPTLLHNVRHFIEYKGIEM